MPLQSKKSVVPVRQSVPPVRQSDTPSILDTVKHSVAMGAGMSIGQRIVGGLLGITTDPSRVIEKDTEKCRQYKDAMDQCIKYTAQESPCYEELRSYVHCINNQ